MLFRSAGSNVSEPIRVAVVDYGAGNLVSIRNALALLGAPLFLLAGLHGWLVGTDVTSPVVMVPAIVLVIPLYAVFSQLGLRDTLLGLLIVYPATTTPVAVGEIGVFSRFDERRDSCA